MWIEAVTQAFKLFVLTVGYAIDEAKQHAAEVVDAKQRRDIFETAVAKALADMRISATAEKQRTDATDDAVDKAVDKQKT